jgi:hypothetical protein
LGTDFGVKEKKKKIIKRFTHGLTMAIYCGLAVVTTTWVSSQGDTRVGYG